MDYKGLIVQDNPPLSNRIANSRSTSQNILGILSWDKSIFDEMTMPSGIDKDIVIDVILDRYGLSPLRRPDPAYLKYHIASWSRRRQRIWKELYDTLNYEYNPIHNYDRTETHTERRDRDEAENETLDENTTQNKVATGDITENQQSNTNSTQNTGEENEHRVSAENADEYQADTMDTRSQDVTGNSDTTVDATSKSESTEDTSLQRDNSRNRRLDVNENGQIDIHAEGNIGVTTTQQMIQAQRDIVQFSVEEYIAQDWESEFCLMLF